MNKQKKFYIFSSSVLTMIITITLGTGLLGYLSLSQKQASISESKYYTEKLDEKKEILGRLQARYTELEPDIPLIEIALPSEKDSSKLLSDLNTLATAANLKLIFMEPNTDSSGAKNNKKKTVSDLSLLQTVKGPLSYELPLEIRVRGSYSSFLSFVRRIENYQRLINIESIDISKQDSTTVPDYIEAVIKIRAYIKK